MEREIVELRKQVAEQANSVNAPTALGMTYQPTTSAYGQIHSPTTHHWGGSQEAAAGLLDLKSGYDGSGTFTRTFAKPADQTKRIEDVTITQDQVAELFHLWVLAR